MTTTTIINIPMPNNTAHAHRMLITICLVILGFMEMLDGSILNTAIPVIAQHFAVTPFVLRDSVTSYLFALAIMTPISGYLADRFGIKNILRIAVVLFALGSILCSLCVNPMELRICRLIQGLGAGIMTPIGRLLMIKMYDRNEIAKITSTVTIPVLLGPILGPVLGGFMTTYLSWQWIFWVNLPFCAFTFWVFHRYQVYNNKAQNHKLNWLGFLLVVGFFSLTSIALEAADRQQVSMSVILNASIAALVCGIAYFVYHNYHSQKSLAIAQIKHNELNMQHAQTPAIAKLSKLVINLHLLKIHLFKYAIINCILTMIAVSGINLLIPMILQKQFGLSPFISGMLVFPSAIGAMIIKPFLHKIYSRLGYKNTLNISGVMLAVSLAMFMFIDNQSRIFYLEVLLAMMLFGLLYNTMLNLNTLSAYDEVPVAQKSDVTSFQSSIMLFSMSIGVSVATIIFMYLLDYNGTYLGDTAHSQLVLHSFHQCLMILALIALAPAIIIAIDRYRNHSKIKRAAR